MVDRDLRTLDHWRDKLGGLPRTIECRAMSLAGRDHEPDVFTGPGRIEIRSASEIRFYMYATTTDAAVAFRKLQSSERNRYDTLEQFRLTAVDYSGNSWAGGYTQVDFFTDYKSGWPLTGVLNGLSTLATGPWVSKSSSIELLLIPPVRLPTSEWMVSTTTFSEQEILYARSPGRQTVNTLGTTIHFEYEPSGEALWITANTSDALSHPYGENWLTEPLRTMLGSLIYPRMVARNMGNGTAHVWLRRTPDYGRRSMLGLMPPFGMGAGHSEAFWDLYTKLLTLVGSARDDEGHPNFDPHEITRFYQELAESQHGSHWVMLLTLASTAEALAKGLMTEADRKPTYSDAEIASMREHMGKWIGPKTLCDRMKSSLDFATKQSVSGFLRNLAGKDQVRKEEIKTWTKLRNSVMHGGLIEPWSTEQGDKHLHELISLVHGLTLRLVEKTLKADNS